MVPLISVTTVCMWRPMPISAWRSSATSAAHRYRADVDGAVGPAAQQRLETLDLIVLSACRTLLGDPDRTWFAGLALQAGARSAVGTLWYVDDVVTSAFFVQFYRLLDLGLPKAEALQRTRQLFASGAIQLQGDVVVGADQAPLLTSLTPAQRRRIAGGVQNPYFWSGIQLIGSPW